MEKSMAFEKHKEEAKTFSQRVEKAWKNINDIKLKKMKKE
jgi:hypothetical protein